MGEFIAYLGRKFGHGVIANQQVTCCVALWVKNLNMTVKDRISQQQKLPNKGMDHDEEIQNIMAKSHNLRKH